MLTKPFKLTDTCISSTSLTNSFLKCKTSNTIDKMQVSSNTWESKTVVI